MPSSDRAEQRSALVRTVNNWSVRCFVVVTAATAAILALFSEAEVLWYDPFVFGAVVAVFGSAYRWIRPKLGSLVAAIWTGWGVALLLVVGDTLLFGWDVDGLRLFPVASGAVLIGAAIVWAMRRIRRGLGWVGSQVRRRFWDAE